MGWRPIVKLESLTAVLQELRGANGAPGWEYDVTWQAQHQLERVEITLTLPTEGSGRTASIVAHGCSSTKRGFLWTWSEEWAQDEMHPGGMEPADLVHHLLLVCHQDRPNSAARLSFGLAGGVYWDEPELPFT